MLSNPVLLREFITSLRTKRALALAIGFLAILSLVVMLLWPAEGVFSIAAQASHKLFILLSMTFLAMVSLCAPSFTALAITAEKEAQTYDLLYDTLLRPDEIVLGKFVAGVGYVLILIVASMPMMGVCMILGGVSFSDVVKVYLIVTAAAVLFGLLGLWCSTLFRSSYRSLICCYLFILMLSGLTWVPSVVFGLLFGGVHIYHLLRGLSPFAALLAVVHPGLFAGQHAVDPGDFGRFADGPLPFLALALAGSIGLLVSTLRRVAQPPQPKPRGDTGVIEDRMELLKRHVKFPFYLLDPRKRKRMMGPLLNIIAVKEMRCKAFGRATWLIRMMNACLIGSLIMAFLPLTQMLNIGIDTIVFTCISIPLGIIILISPVLTASAVSGEIESGVFDLLRCTPVSARTFVMGKLEVAWLFTALLVLSCFPTFFVLAYISSSPEDMEHVSAGMELIRPFNFQFAAGWEELQKVNLGFVYSMLAALAVVMMSMLFTSLAGLAASAWAGKTATATAISYAVAIIFAFGTLIPYFIAEALPGQLVRWVVTFNPFAAAAKAVSNDVFPTLSPRLWLEHLQLTAGASGALFLAGILKVWRLMRPQR